MRTIFLYRVSAHRIVLSASSAYFSAMFFGSLRESHQEEIKLGEVLGEPLQMLIQYCYTGTIELREDNVETLLATACLLQLTSVVSACCNFLGELTKGNKPTFPLNIPNDFLFSFRIYAFSQTVASVELLGFCIICRATELQCPIEIIQQVHVPSLHASVQKSRVLSIERRTIGQFVEKRRFECVIRNGCVSCAYGLGAARCTGTGKMYSRTIGTYKIAAAAAVIYCRLRRIAVRHKRMQSIGKWRQFVHILCARSHTKTFSKWNCR